jgi:UDP-N-acetylmuramyl pentapeptide phosphotransferase/UDP-N-acetylglucosamine-1-phosphate transferase
MPFSPSDLDWWAWLLIAAVGAILSLLVFNLRKARTFDGLFITIGGLIGIASLLCGVVGVVRFIKWAWGG